MKCGSGNQCLVQNSIDCGGGRSCPAGNVCVNGGAECLTPAAIAERAAAEKQAAQTKAELEKRLKLLPVQQKKEDTEAEAWLKSEQAELAKASAEKLAKQQAQYEKSKAYTERIAPQLCAHKPSCESMVVQVSTLSPGTQSTQLATINATWTPAKTQIITIIPGTERQQSSTALPPATGTPIQTIAIGPIGKPVNVGTATSIGSPVSITGILQSLGNSKLVQIGLDSAAAAGGDAAKLLLSGRTLTAANALGNLSTVAEIAAAYKTGGWLTAWQSVAEQTTIIAGGDLGAALVPTNPLVGKAIGTAVSEGAIYAGETYGSPLIASGILYVDPTFGVK
jgi:hypothetical protein